MLKKQHWHLIRAAIFIILSLYIIPQILPKIALHYSPGGLRMPSAPYLNAGLLLVFMLIAVFLKNYNNLEKLRGPKIWEMIVFGALAAMEFAWFTGLLFAITKTLFIHLFLAGLAYGSGMLFLMVAVLGLDVFKKLWKDMAVVVSMLIFYSGITLFVDATRFHLVTARIAQKIMSLFIKVSIHEIQGQPLMSVSGFATIIGPPCSGIFSMVLFTALFSFVYWLDREKINGRKALKFYIIGVIGAFVLNLLRVIALMIIGSYWSPELAVGLFHTNAGWILFAVYSFAYWWLAYPYLTKK